MMLRQLAIKTVPQKKIVRIEVVGKSHSHHVLRVPTYYTLKADVITSTVLFNTS